MKTIPYGHTAAFGRKCRERPLCRSVMLFVIPVQPFSSVVASYGAWGVNKRTQFSGIGLDGVRVVV
jgi:hypothetical protein